MNTYISLILTAIVTISTIIYTICSIQSRDFPASCFQQSLGRTKPLPRDFTAAGRSRNRFLTEGVGPDVGIHGRQSGSPRCRKERSSIRRISPKGLSLSVRKRRPCFENAVGRTLGREEKASLIYAHYNAIGPLSIARGTTSKLSQARLREPRFTRAKVAFL